MGLFDKIKRKVTEVVEDKLSEVTEEAKGFWDDLSGESARKRQRTEEEKQLAQILQRHAEEKRKQEMEQRNAVANANPHSSAPAAPTTPKTATPPPVPVVPNANDDATDKSSGMNTESKNAICKELDFVVSEETIKANTVNGVLRIPEGVTSIDKKAFSGCGNLTSVVIPNSVITIGDEAFSGCEELTQVTIGNSVTSIGKNAFNRCEKLKSVIIPDSVTSIGESAFLSCEELTQVTIGKSVKSIGAFAFASGVQKLVWNAEDANSISQDWINDELWEVVIGNEVIKIPNNFLPKTQIESLVIPNSVTTIGHHAFEECTELKSLKLGDNVKRIGDNAFQYCPIEELTLPESLLEIGEFAFNDCAFDKLIIPDSVVKIGENAFLLNSKLREATIGASVKSCYDIFNGCSNLTELVVRSEVAEYTGTKSLTKVTICDTVKELGKWAFAECPNLEEVVIPDSVTKIGYGAFVADENLKTVEIPDSVTEIGEGAFAKTPIRELVMPRELTKIGRLGDGMSKLRKLDFSKVTKLRTLPEEFLGDSPKVKELVLPMGLNTVEEIIGGQNLNSLFLPPTTEEVEDLGQMDLSIYCYAPELDELEPIIGQVDEENQVTYPNHLFVLPQHLESYLGQRRAEGLSEDLLTIEAMPEEYQYYYDS